MTGLLALAYLAFISLGLPDTVLGVAWPVLRVIHDVPHAALGATTAAAAIAYFASGLLAGRLVDKLGTGGVLGASTALVVAGIVGYAMAPTYALFVVAAAVTGAGSGAVDAALNVFAAASFRPRHMSWLHAAWALGASIGPAVMTTSIAQGHGARGGYLALAAPLLALAAMFTLLRRRLDAPVFDVVAAEAGAAPEGGATAEERGGVAGRGVPVAGRVPLQLATFFAYAGLEAGIGQWATTILVLARGLSSTAAGAWTTAYWTSLLAGRVVAGLVVERTGPVRLARIGAATALAGTAAFACGIDAGLVVVGLGLAPIYPGLMSASPRRHGASSARVVGYSVSAATAGIAIIPAALGVVVDRSGAGAATIVLVGVAAAMVVAHELLVRRD